MRTRLVLSIIIVILISICSITQAATISVTTMTMQEYLSKDNKSELIFVDVRSEKGRLKSGLEIPGTVWINPYSADALNKFIAETDKEKAILIYCSCTDDYTSIRAAQILIKNGFTNVCVLENGWRAWQEAKLPVTAIINNQGGEK